MQLHHIKKGLFKALFFIDAMEKQLKSGFKFFFYWAKEKPFP
jgi:hypothetical protein